MSQQSRRGFRRERRRNSEAEESGVGSRQASTLKTLQGSNRDMKNMLAAGREYTLDDLPPPQTNRTGVNVQPEMSATDSQEPQRSTDVLWSSRELEQKSYQAQASHASQRRLSPVQVEAEDISPRRSVDNAEEARSTRDQAVAPIDGVGKGLLRTVPEGVDQDTEEEECKSEPAELNAVREDKGDTTSVYGEHVVKPSRPKQSPPNMPKPRIPRVAPPSAPMRPPYPPKALDPSPPKREPFAPSGNPKPPRRPPYPPKQLPSLKVTKD